MTRTFNLPLRAFILATAIAAAGCTSNPLAPYASAEADRKERIAAELRKGGATEAARAADARAEANRKEAARQCQDWVECILDFVLNVVDRSTR